MSTILITGGAGYFGSLLARQLLSRGFSVIVVDRLFFGRESVSELEERPDFTLLAEDIRNLDASVFAGVDGVVDLAAISNDPSGELDPEATLSINHRGRVRVARLAREAGVKRYILASSCSVYGFRDEAADETTAPNPLTTYARANVEAEAEVLPLASDGFAPLVLRFATLYGLSHRMRMDLAVNGMTLGLYQDGTIPVLRDGTQWRPLLHVRDACAAVLAALKAPVEKVSGQILNVGSNQQNLRILPLAQELALALNVQFVPKWYGEPDHRSYRVIFDRIEQTLPFRCMLLPRVGAREIVEALEKGTLVVDESCYTVKTYKRLVREQADILRPPVR